MGTLVNSSGRALNLAYLKRAIEEGFFIFIFIFWDRKSSFLFALAILDL